MIPFGAAGFKHNSLSVVFALLIVVLSMRIKIDNKMLRWCGELLFPLYIYQRIPMMVMAALVPSFVVQMPLLYIAICFTSTILMAYLYRFIKVSL